jgi:hypothetical protein
MLSIQEKNTSVALKKYQYIVILRIKYNNNLILINNNLTLKS